ncbi:polyprenyl synthetase family protein [Sulfoacidibacillus thermotolerans]|uniref:Heptaprenyl diphosphate synthase n=1 Tax=Sulfoacidibacillus thermotolerans TaxID=1765684 RepID=A0A2U3DCV5_SULT2|nr:polyprenyl synthetase family protein [Sulfoacidibacillus thermotolerans]PWI59075.1 heptaprenyl diphosphate synthase [Sulfoacidibacillus thermotolerans]
MVVADLYADLELDLAYVEERLRDQLRSSQPALEHAAIHLLQAGGKRLRPVFVLLAGKFGDYDIHRLEKVAVGLELIHMATLVHDDVIDNAETRRGNPTVKAHFGNRVAMYTGDFIFAQALSVLSGISQPRAHHILSIAIERMCVGEIEQIRDLYSLQQSFRNYLKRIRRKTALLIEMSCALGAIVSDSDSNVVSTLRRFGYYAGMAFQITDDILDFTASAERLGKPIGGDLRQGNITIPVLFALQDAKRNAELNQLISPTQTPDQVSRAIAIVKESGGITSAQDLADRYLQKAECALASLPSSPARDSLMELAKFVGKRDH